MHTHSLLRALQWSSLMVVGGALGLGVLMSVPAAAATTTWTANFQVVNLMPAAPRWTITLAIGCSGAASKTKLGRGGDTLDVKCTVDSETAHLAYTVQWSLETRDEALVEVHDGTVPHSCEQDETAKVTFTDVALSPLNRDVTHSTQCVAAPEDGDSS